ncbi:DUF6191 domain-containing protein [Streptomyces sp. DSM 41982]|uniref:DUF6191 domain-containing protein n=1 Tax=Streptomyces evansiae TaxID=3075535 RepID=A0ABD5EAN6_9ACTN|nr:MULTISPECIES: DUF6191 domain-containing protein [unclassified Streptomyces]MDT0418459.1 DUF6191 domain-containing protein [Streptomyces sp. DSM 41982]SCD44099.1 hypothetical protein GA0115246_101782 [Streptomyces sp. SolWspMP-sol7th]
MFSAFDMLFNPGRKHTDDERSRLELTREDVGDGDPGHGPVDLRSGKVTVRVTTSGLVPPTTENTPEETLDPPAPEPRAVTDPGAWRI